MIEMIAVAMRELVVGDPALYSTDVGRVIDAGAHASLARHAERLRHEARLVGETPLHFAPIAFELERIADVKEEIFGSVLHIMRWSGDVCAVIDEVNRLG